MSEKKLIDKERLEMYLNDWMLNISGDGYENMSERKRARYDTLEQVFDAVSRFPTIAPETLRPVAQWISVKDRLPNADEGDVFLAVSKNGNFVFEAYFERDCGLGKNLWHDGCGNFYGVTHWMPLPEPPEDNVCHYCPVCGAKMEEAGL